MPGMPGPRRSQAEPLTDDERAILEEQTKRNIDGMELESAGRMDLAIELYEQNVEEGFAGDWPYSRLVSVYERQGDKLVVNAPNCIDCKATDVVGPRWTPREGGSGPSYKRM